MKTPTKNRDKSSVHQKRGVSLSPELQLMLFVLANIVFFSVLFNTVYNTPYTGTGLYFDYASNVMKGLMPYRDFTLEYPPFALFFFILPRLAAPTYTVFALFYQLEVLIFELVGLFMVYSIARRLGKPPWKLLMVYTICILAIGPISAQQYDLFPAIMVLFSLYYFWIGKHKLSWALLALGTMTKLFPAVIAPIYLIYYIRNHEYKNAYSGLITLGVICLVIVLPFLITGPDIIRNLAGFHAQRGIQLESTYSSFLLALDQLGLTSVKLTFNFGSWNVASPVADVLAKASTYLLGIFLLAAYWFIYSRMKPGKSQFSRIGTYSLLVLGIVLITSKILSPQYLIWIVPLFPLVFNRWRYTLLSILVVTGAMTYYIFPRNYLVLVDLNTRMVWILFFRNILLILLTALAAVSLRRMKSAE
jgi:uncharacterized membrane protein